MLRACDAYSASSLTSGNLACAPGMPAQQHTVLLVGCPSGEQHLVSSEGCLGVLQTAKCFLEGPKH